jgi:hypothetical protein
MTSQRIEEASPLHAVRLLREELRMERERQAPGGIKGLLAALGRRLRWAPAA